MLLSLCITLALQSQSIPKEKPARELASRFFKMATRDWEGKVGLAYDAKSFSLEVIDRLERFRLETPWASAYFAPDGRARSFHISGPGPSLSGQRSIADGERRALEALKLVTGFDSTVNKVDTTDEAWKFSMHATASGVEIDGWCNVTVDRGSGWVTQVTLPHFPFPKVPRNMKRGLSQHSSLFVAASAILEVYRVGSLSLTPSMGPRIRSFPKAGQTTWENPRREEGDDLVTSVLRFREDSAIAPGVKAGQGVFVDSYYFRDETAFDTVFDAWVDAATGEMLKLSRRVNIDLAYLRHGSLPVPRSLPRPIGNTDINRISSRLDSRPMTATLFMTDSPGVFSSNGLVVAVSEPGTLSLEVDLKQRIGRTISRGKPVFFHLSPEVTAVARLLMNSR